MSKAKKSRGGKMSDLKGKKITDKAANQVKGGFNPQPDPPAVQGSAYQKVAPIANFIKR